MWPEALFLWLVPPGLFLLIALAGLVVQFKWRWVGIFILSTDIIVWFALSLPLTGMSLIASLETSYRPLRADSLKALDIRKSAIVVLGAGRYARAPEFDTDTVDAATLQRLHYAAFLQRRTKLPILVSGRRSPGDGVTSAELMKKVLETEFRARVRWVERTATNTFESAQYAKDLLDRKGIRRVLLVTHAWHMRRALWSFNQVGLKTLPAPTGFTTTSNDNNRILGSLPTARGLSLSSRALAERLTFLRYRWRYGSREK